MAKKETARGQAQAAQTTQAAREELARRASELHLPRYDELPDFDIYMDQLLLFVERALAPVASPDDKPLTSSMVNNYVKMRIVPAVHGKRYGRDHVAMLMTVCLAKRAFSITRISQMAGTLVASGDVRSSYDAFCGLFEERMRAVAGAAASPTSKQRADARGGGGLLPAIVDALANVIYLDDLLALAAHGKD